MLVDLAGLGERFSGTGYVSSVHHRPGTGVWITDIRIGLGER
jgi:hypothetical protein